MIRTDVTEFSILSKYYISATKTFRICDKGLSQKLMESQTTRLATGNVGLWYLTWGYKTTGAPPTHHELPDFSEVIAPTMHEK